MPFDIGELTQQFEASFAELKAALSGDKEKLARLDKALSEQGAQLAALEQNLARRRGDGSAMPQAKSLGAVVAQHDDFKAYAAKSGRRGKVNIQVNSLITSDPGSAGGLVAPDRQRDVTMLAQKQLKIRDLLDVRPTNSGTIEYQRQTLRDINADVVSEGTLKPESTFEFEDVTARVVTIAHWTKASKQVLADAPQLQAILDGEMTYGVNQKEEQQILYGTGTGQELEGIMEVAAAYTAPFALSDATFIDTLRLAMLQARLALFPVTGFVLHPSDWARIELTKDGQGRYIVGGAGATPTLWNKPVVESDSIQEGAFLTGAFGLASQLFDREEANVMLSDEDSDNFVKNLVTVLAEERVALVHRRPDALVAGSF